MRGPVSVGSSSGRRRPLIRRGRTRGTHRDDSLSFTHTHNTGWPSLFSEEKRPNEKGFSTGSVDSDYSAGKETITSLSSIADYKFEMKSPKLSAFNSLFKDSVKRRPSLMPLPEKVEEAENPQSEDDWRPERPNRFTLMEDRNEFGKARTRSLEAKRR